ncbi:MAG: alpha-L-fucosidase [Parvibaculum sp.]|uniref:alpha-L-fucosidase n=1 Tax=Parvibaculum sp. TaxID=2024848 RepID=UPI002841AFEA|nr:alpha-L-fucosidase [Parvibaculum sp.]MDR3497810.1 alpha-L-fucosidase [Parvibaculum sp.]
MKTENKKYEPSLASLNTHQIPGWYDDAKFGIFIHWGLFAIPGFASSYGSIGEVFAQKYDTAVALTPYTEWYENAIKVPESDSAKHHAEVYGNAPYEDFRAPFLKGLEQWDPKAWARLFKQAGAKYVVLVTKHHDGYSLWPTEVPHPKKRGWHTTRDIVGELGDAVRAEGLEYGLYYSGGIDWSFNTEPLRTLGDFTGSTPGGAYPAYAVAQVKELIDRYKPAVLWNDISWPTPLSGLMKTVAYYYNTVPEGVTNDRWMPVSWKTKLLRFKFIRRRFDKKVKEIMQSRGPQKGIIPPEPPHYDFRTPEYTTFPDVQKRKWEATRGMSHSFGYNRRDKDEDYLPVDEIVRGFVDAVSKNGNLLLNVGPRGEDAQIPGEQVSRLLGFGAWLEKNGEAIYGTRPHTHAEGKTADGHDVRYTRKGETLYAIVLDAPTSGEITILDLAPEDGASVALLGHGNVAWRRAGNGIAISLPPSLAPSPAISFSITPFRA